MTNDHWRQADLEELGWTVIRFTNAQALGQPHVIAEAIRNHAAAII